MGDKDLNCASYAKEELRAELSSVFMCQRLGISYQLEKDQTHIENSAAYLKGWKSMLNNDKAEFFKAARDANKITAYLVDGKSFERLKKQEKRVEKSKADKQEVAKKPTVRKPTTREKLDKQRTNKKETGRGSR